MKTIPLLFSVLFLFLSFTPTQAQVFVIERVASDERSLGLFGSGRTDLLLVGHFESQNGYDTIISRYDSLTGGYLKNESVLFMIHDGYLYVLHKETPFKIKEMYGMSSFQKSKLECDLYYDVHDEVNENGGYLMSWWFSGGYGVRKSKILSGNIQLTYCPDKEVVRMSARDLEFPIRFPMSDIERR